MNGPLAGVRILDLTHVWAGPLAVRFLSDLGADVVKVEAPYGRGPREFPYEPLGGWLGGEPGDEPWNANAIFVKLHRNRRALCLDLKDDRGKALFLSLVGVADVVIENFSARAMPSMGLDYDALKAANPNIVYVTMPGFGSTGPYRRRVAFGPTVEPMSGLTNMLGYGPDEPRNSAMALMDPIMATHGFAAVVTALRNRGKEGHGARVELSLHEAGVSFSGPWLVDTALGIQHKCVGNRHPAMAPHGVFQCAGNDKWIALACPDDDAWARLSELLGLPPANSTLAERQAREDEIEAAITNWTSAQSRKEATMQLQSAAIPAGPVNTTPDMTSDPQVVHRQFFTPYEKFETPMPGNPLHMPGVNRDTWRPCPGLGEHNAEVLADWLGYSPQQSDELEAAGVLFDAPPG